MKQISPFAKVKTNRTNLSILLLITHFGFGTECSHSNDNYSDCQSEHRFKGFSISVLQQILELEAQFLLAGTNDLIKYKI